MLLEGSGGKGSVPCADADVDSGADDAPVVDAVIKSKSAPAVKPPDPRQFCILVFKQARSSPITGTSY